MGGRVTLIEKDKIGGTCLNRGCIPTKSLLADAKMLRKMRHSLVFRQLAQPDFDPLPSMMERKVKVVQDLVNGIEILLQSQRVTVKQGRADLLTPSQVVLLDKGDKREVLDADAIILAPGSHSKSLPNLNPDGKKMITSDEALELKEIPREIVIIGGGYIGMEFATLLNILGSKVTIVEVLENILPGLEPEMIRQFRRVIEADGVKILTQSTIEETSSAGDGLKLVVKTPQGIQEIMTEKVLVSVGRGPNLDLDFSKASVEISPKGIHVNSKMETTAPNVYAIGDATGGILLAHVASEQGVIAAENAMGMNRQMEHHAVPLCIFTYPEIASIGLTEKEARARGEIKMGRFPFRSNPTAVISDETEGLVKVIASRENDEVLGVHIIGPEASVLVSVAGSLMKQTIKLRDFGQMMQAHPTVPEALKEAALDADGLAIHLPKPLRPSAKKV
ncbi:MAG: dihydrolipoyl dehydrogenase [Desulfobacterales bacterium]|nr:dihydrolipoyl dehydrogenase [Desulfobacterales bacterium]